jgi:hypothetical protein
MAVSLCISLFGKPGQELDEGEAVTPQALRDLAEDLRARLTAAADLVEKLTAAGWEAEMHLYDIGLYHPYINTAVQAEQQLLDLGIPAEALSIDEWPDEEEDLDDEALE